jgi:regulator of sirC expression with transglutaminase-like and TPR domain
MVFLKLMSGERIDSKEIGYLLDFYAEVEDDSIRTQILDRLIDSIPFGHHPLRFIESIEDAGRRCQIRLHAMDDLNERKLISDLQTFLRMRNGSIADIETGVYLISRLSHSHTITPETFRADLDRLAEPLTDRLHRISRGLPAEKLDTLIDYLFFEKGFRGNTENYYDPENSYLTSLLRTGIGIPVSLSVLTLLVGRRAGLSLEGINLPGHFILRYEENAYCTYFDPFNEGSLLSEEDCVRFMLRQGISPAPEYFLPADGLTILKRMYRNLMNHYSSCGDRKKEETLNRHFAIVNNQTLHR